jgi:chromosome partitioning protein
MVIAIGGIKGGSGKTTIATNLTVLRAAAGRDVLLIDGDRQATAADFTAVRDDAAARWPRYQCVPLTGRALGANTPRLIRRHDDVVLDTDGQDADAQIAAMELADVLLVPFVPRSFDFWTLDRVAERVEDVRTVNRRLRACAFLNRVDTRGADVAEAEDILRESGVIEVLPTRIASRKAFGLAASRGLAVTELRPEDRKASAEIVALYDHVFSATRSWLTRNPTTG